MGDLREGTIEDTREPREAERYRVPNVDIFETADSLVLLADMPGVGEQGIDVSVEQDTLDIIGRVDAPAEGVGLYREFHPRPFRRTFILSSDIRRDVIVGKIQNGVLRLTLPKAEQARVRRIPIQAL